MAAVSSVLSSDQITSLIQQAQTAYQAPANALQAQEQPIQTQISALGKVQGALSSLQSAIAGLADVQTLAQRTVTTSPSGIVSATATNDAVPGSYSVTGVHLAQAETLVSSGSASTSASLGSGSITIQVGSGSATTINIASGQGSLAGIANAIDQANLGVEASVLYDGSSYRLVLTGGATGSGNAFTVTGSGGLAGLSYSAGSSGASGLTEVQSATNATFSLNGVAITSGTNSIKGVVPGLTLSLTASGSATVQVSEDVSALDEAANSLVTALNTVLSTINQYSTYTAASGGGPLLGDIGVQLLRSGLLNAITQPGGSALQGSPYNSLSAIGFNITSGGTVTFDDATFQSAAQSNYGAVAVLLGSGGIASNANVSVEDVGAAQPGTYAIDIATNSGGTLSGTVNGEAASGTGGLLVVNGAGAAQGLSLQIAAGVTGSLGSVTVSQGLFGTLSSLANSALASGSGSLTTELSSLNDSITSMNQQIAALQQEAQQETLLLTQQYATAQATLTQLTTVSNFLSTYFNQSSGSGG